MTDLIERLRAATMGFDWSDLPDDALILAVPLLREAVTALSQEREERDEWQRRAERAENALPGEVERRAQADYVTGLEASLASLEAERDDARRQRDEIGRAWDEADARAKEAEARAASLEKALAPFAKVGHAIKGRSVEYTIKADGYDLNAPLVDANDFQSAAALSSSKQKDGE